MNWDTFDAMPAVNVVAMPSAEHTDLDHGRVKKAPIPTSSTHDSTYAKFSEEKVPIPLRVLMAAQSQFQLVSVETDTGYTYTGELESVDANMNVKIKDPEVKKEVWVMSKQPTVEHAVPRTLRSSHLNYTPQHDASPTTLERKTIYHKPPAYGTSVMIRGATVTMIQLPPSLEPEQRYLASILKKELAEKRRKDKKERLERLVEKGKKRSREAAEAASAPVDGEGTDKAQKKLAKAQEAARVAEQKLRKMVKMEDKQKRFQQKRSRKGQS